MAPFTEGMKVIRQLRHKNDYELHTIQRVTKTQAILENGERYTQSQGERIGDSQWSLYAAWIEEATPEVLERKRKAQQERKQQELCKQQKAAVLHWIQHDMTPDEIERLYRDFVNCGMPKVD